MPYFGVTPAAEFTSKDLNGEQLILDADADTTITADTDDQIDIRIAGADDFQFTANTFTAQSGSTIAAQALTGTTGVFSSDVTGLTINATGDTAASDNAAIGYTSAEGLILTGQGSTDDITIKNDADTTVVNVATGATDVEISAGNIVMGTASKGIYLGVTSATAANLLADYEEGNWTPGFAVDSDATGVSYGSQVGQYVKVGKYVYCQFYLRLTDNGTATGNVTITGLPFTASNIGAGSYGGCYFNWRLGHLAGAVPTATVQKNDTYCYVSDLQETSTEHGGYDQDEWTNAGRVYGTITYISA
jgi:hypothetical protein